MKTMIAGRALATVVPLTASLMLTACGGFGRLPTSYALFDLGMVAPVTPPASPAPAQLEVRAPSWLDSSAMQYRLAYSGPNQRHAYAQSRWVAEPAEMLGLALDRALRQGVPQSECRLRLRLDEFIQVFDAVDASRAELRVRTELLPRRGESALASSDFMVAVPAPTADAEGGVAAYRDATHRLAEVLRDWLSGLDRGQGEGLNTAARCRS